MPANKTTKPAAKTTKTKAAKPANTKAPKAAAPAKTTKKRKADGKMSALDAAAKGLWTSPVGATPDRTLYSVMLREVTLKGADARFVKVERGQLAAKK
jgi:hypothetical protein